MNYLRGLARELATLYPDVNLSFTGEVPLEHEELETVNRGMVISSLASLLLVPGSLWIGFRSLRLLFVTFIALIVGLVVTTGFAAAVFPAWRLTPTPAPPAWVYYCLLAFR